MESNNMLSAINKKSRSLHPLILPFLLWSRIHDFLLWTYGEPVNEL